METLLFEYAPFQLYHGDGFTVPSREIISFSLIVAFAAFTAFLALKYLSGRHSAPKEAPVTPQITHVGDKGVPSRSFKAPTREQGVWKPVAFERPKTSPYPDWSVRDTKPLPYRPFRWGPYFITMGLRSMPWDEWIELDNEFPRFHAEKKARIEERGPKLSRTAPEATESAYELLEEFRAYLPDRYPSLFRRTDVGLDNLHTGESFNIIERPLKEDPTQMAARMIQDDIAIMIEKPDGQHYLLAAAIIIPGTWRLEDKYGMSLSEIHTSGNVAGFKPKLEKGMMNFFRRVQPDSPVIRNNYFFQIDDNLAWSTSLGPEDKPPHKEGEEEVHTNKIAWRTAEKDKGIEHHWFRSERQSLRRLPRTGGIVFTIRTYFHPVVDIAEEPGVPGRLASAVRSWGDDVAMYKGRERYQDVLLEYLDGKHREQLDKGVVRDDEKHDWGEGYPW